MQFDWAGWDGATAVLRAASEAQITSHHLVVDYARAYRALFQGPIVSDEWKRLAEASMWAIPQHGDHFDEAFGTAASGLWGGVPADSIFRPGTSEVVRAYILALGAYMGLSVYSQTAGRLIAEAMSVLLGLAVPQNAWVALAIQAAREVANGATWAAGVKFNNPLNLTTARGAIVWPGQTGTYGGGSEEEWHEDFAAFGTLEAGCWACATNYVDGPSYSGVVQAFYTDDAVKIAEAIAESPWSSDHYGYALVEDVRQYLQEVGVTPDDIEKIADAVAKKILPEVLTKLDSGFNVTTATLLDRLAAGDKRVETAELDR